MAESGILDVTAALGRHGLLEGAATGEHLAVLLPHVFEVLPQLPLAHQNGQVFVLYLYVYGVLFAHQHREQSVSLVKGAEIRIEKGEVHISMITQPLLTEMQRKYYHNYYGNHQIILTFAKRRLSMIVKMTSKNCEHIAFFTMKNLSMNTQTTLLLDYLTDMYIDCYSKRPLMVLK